MRNILITVMMLIVVALLFTTIIDGDNGIKRHIEQKGEAASDSISGLMRAN